MKVDDDLRKWDGRERNRNDQIKQKQCKLQLSSQAKQIGFAKRRNIMMTFKIYSMYYF